MQVGNRWRFHSEAVKLYSVLFVPTLGKNLLSVSNLTKHGVSVVFGSACAYFLRVNLSVGRTMLGSEGMYHLPNSLGTESAFVTLTKESMDIWHARLEHLNSDDLRKFAAGAGKVVGVTNVKSNDICDGSAKGEQHRLPFPKEGKHRADEPLVRDHADVCGPVNIPSLAGSGFF